MSLKRISAAVALATLFASCTHVGTKVGNLSKGGFTTIVVDAGHGGKDNGGTSGRGSNPFQREKDLTLDTAKRVRDLLRRSGFRVVMMREGDYFIELDERVARANKEGSHAILVSIHYNATSNSSKSGAETYFWRADSHGLATRMESHLVSATGEHNGGVIRRRLRLTRNPDIRCVGSTVLSGSRTKREYSLCTAAIGCTACPRRTVSADTSDKPKWSTFPTRTNSDRAADKSLVVTLAVDVASINKVDAEIKYPFNGGQRFFLFNWVINAR